MKTFLENLKKELEKRDFSKEDIEEILEDHKEMIETAQKEGLSDDDLAKKFGDPINLAQDLLESKSTNNEEKGETNVNGYELFKTFPVTEKAFDVSISLVSDDVQYVVHNEEQIEVYYKDIKNMDDYKIDFNGQKFSIEHKPLKNIFGLKSTSGRIIIKMPEDIINKVFNLKIVSGDVTLEFIQTNEFDIKTTSGDITAKNIQAEAAKLSTVSGDVLFDDMTLSSLDLSMVSGDAKILNTTVANDIGCNSVSGDVYFNTVTAKEFSLKTVSGDCKGLEFYPESVKLKSVTGDINITNKEREKEIIVVSKKTMSGDININ